MDSICLSICHETTFLIEMLFDSRVRMFIISVFIIAERRVYQIRVDYVLVIQAQFDSVKSVPFTSFI